MNLNQLEKIWAMTYKELQEALKSLKAEGKTKIKLNSSKNDLEKEYIKIIREDENKVEKLETEQSAKESEVMAVNVTEDETVLIIADEKSIAKSYTYLIKSKFNTTLERFANAIYLGIEKVEKAILKKQSLKVFLERILKNFKQSKKVSKSFELIDLCFMITLKMGLNFSLSYNEVYSWAEEPNATLEQFLTYCSC